VFRNRTKHFWAILIVVVALIVFYLPSLVAFRYTAAEQRTSFLTHPWRSWSFAYTALTVPGDSKLKTSGQALRTAQSLFAGSQVHAREVRVLFLAAGQPYSFTNRVAGVEVTATIKPRYRFVWRVTGTVDVAPRTTVVVAMLDYRSGDLLYDVRSDLPQPLTPMPGPSVSPGSTSSPGPAP